jgi:hypothetical protein
MTTHCFASKRQTGRTERQIFCMILCGSFIIFFDEAYFGLGEKQIATHGLSASSPCSITTADKQNNHKDNKQNRAGSSASKNAQQGEQKRQIFSMILCGSFMIFLVKRPSDLGGGLFGEKQVAMHGPNASSPYPPPLPISRTMTKTTDKSGQRAMNPRTLKAKKAMLNKASLANRRYSQIRLKSLRHRQSTGITDQMGSLRHLAPSSCAATPTGEPSVCQNSAPNKSG